MLTTVYVYNQSVALETSDSRLIDVIKAFIKDYYTKTETVYGQQQKSVVEKCFVGKIDKKPIWYFHVNQFAHLYSHLKALHVNTKEFETVDCRFNDAETTDYRVREGWVLRPDQEPPFEFVTSNPKGSRLLPLVTGSGKTAVALFALAHLRKRAGVVILPTFMDKWVEDIVTIHDADKKDIAVVSGYKAIATLVANAREDHIDHDYFIFSAKTLQEFIKNYEADPDECVELYGCAPTDLFPLLGIGVMLVDETHMAFHSLYKTTVYMNVDYQIGLSATLIAEDPVTARVHRVMYPSRCIYGDTMLKQYLDIYALGYNLSPHFAGKIKTANYGSSTYSHTAFEKSIMKHREIRKGYFELIKATIEDFYDRDYIAGDKLMVFVATVAMATELTAYLANCYPDKQCVRYCEEDSYEDMLKGEIIVTTVISAGTGLDVPNLRVGIQTVSVSSAVSNIQTAGRLRKLPDRDVKFIYLYCINIPKQRQYHTKRKEIFAGRVANYHCLMASKGLR